MTRLHGWAPRGERAYVEQFLVPTLKPSDVVILDNLGSHKGKAVRKAIRDVGARLVFLPKYSPDLNPIEQVFGSSTRSRKATGRPQRSSPPCATIGSMRTACSMDLQRRTLSPSSRPCCERSERELTRPSPTPAAKSLPNTRQPNAPHTSRMPGMRRPKRDTLMVEPRTDCDGLLNCADTLRSPGTTNETGGSDCGRWRNATFAPIAGVPGPFCRRVSSTRSGHRALEARPIERVNRPGAVENCGGGVHLVADFS